ncbi:MAG: MFS transporter [Hyphomicrobiales bacterium]|nr:MAG: MFS transporter [Hyphomicrobiales bacterium]
MSGSGKAFFGWRVVAAVFVLAVFGWGLGFYGPPIYLHEISKSRGWPLGLVSAAVTVHYLFGALVVASLPRLYARFGLVAVTKAACVLLALGVLGWASAREPWQLFAATLLSGAGWAGMGAAAVNALIAPWFTTGRPAALASAYNGASVGGILFSPLWVAAIDRAGFPTAAAAIGLVMIAVIFVLARLYFAKTPAALGIVIEDSRTGSAQAVTTSQGGPPRPLRANVQFLTLSAGMALGLFAQIGLLAHLFSLLVPTLGAQGAGIAAGMATVAAIAGRTLFGWLMPVGADRRLVACASYGIQIAGSLAFLAAGGGNVALILVGVALFGFGIGNATSLPPTIAQVEFSKEDAARVVPLIVAGSQATYAFAPAAFGLLREVAGASPETSAAPALFVCAAVIQGLAIIAFLLGRRTRA